jgi:ribosomal protein S18 acetylase RimI-like enzyme
MQFNAQRTGYRQQYPRSEDFVVLIGDEPAGRLWMDESGEKVVVMDIAIAREHQGRGIGRAVLQHVIEKAEGAGKSVRLTVDRMNARAFELYLRLGFEVCGGDDVYIEMQSAPGSAPNSIFAKRPKWDTLEGHHATSFRREAHNARPGPT